MYRSSIFVILLCCVAVGACSKKSGDASKATPAGDTNEATAADDTSNAAGANDPGKAKDFGTYQKKSKSTETLVSLRRLHDSLRGHYMLSDEPNPSPEAVKLGANEESKSLPPSVGPMPAKGACCEDGERCEPKEELWSDPTWKALEFKMRRPHYYSYEYKRNEDGKGFVLLAYGDLDCDGTYSTFRLNGVIGADDEIESAGDIEKENPLE